MNVNNNNSCYITNNFLTIAENEAVYNLALEKRQYFNHTQTIYADGKVATNGKERHSYELPKEEIKKVYDTFENNINNLLPKVKEQLLIEDFEFDKYEIHLTAHNDGGFLYHTRILLVKGVKTE